MNQLTTIPPYPFNIFISFGGSRGSGLAAALRNDIEILIGPTITFLSVGSISGGNFWAEQIQRALSSQNCCIVILDSIGVNRPWVYYEVGAATALKNGIIIPIVLDISQDQIDRFPLDNRQMIRVMHDNLFIREEYLRIFLSIFDYASTNNFL